MEPSTALDARYSDPAAEAIPWATAADHWVTAELAWLSTVRPDGRPHVTPLIFVYFRGALYFSSGPEERKVRNLNANPQCALTTGRNDYGSGIDLVVEGTARRVTDDDRLRELAEAWVAKYGEQWRFGVADGAFRHEEGGAAQVYELIPRTGFGFAKGTFGQTRWSW